MNYTEKRLEEFRKRTDMPQRFEDIEKSLYCGEKYPESEYELSETKLEEFLAESIAQAIAEDRERVRGVIEKLYEEFSVHPNENDREYMVERFRLFTDKILSSLPLTDK